MAKSDQLTFVLVPAGSTAWEEAGRVTGGADLPLCPEGRAQASKAADELAARSISLVLHAADDASVETAKLIASATGSGCKTRTVEALAEMSLGLWEGLAAEEFAEKFPTASKQWQEDPASVVPPEGETLSAADERIIASLARALEKTKTGGAVAVVLRPVALGLVRCWLRGLPVSKVWESGDPDVSTGAAEWHALPRAELKGVRARTSA